MYYSVSKIETKFRSLEFPEFNSRMQLMIQIYFNREIVDFILTFRTSQTYNPAWYNTFIAAFTDHENCMGKAFISSN